ncbi:FeoA family protein [Psychromonas ossibalaenae]|uniref:FeoA family protein n=1 Tax=Psychromonas ossibalaenae TaxID=444922 RepID=UPI00037F5A31|nr:FeoA family protein [Psychromonas ossibalaenae]
MVLSDLKVGQSASIINMHEMEPVMRKKLLNMGFLPKANVELLRIAPMGDPIAVRCANSSIALRKTLASQIKVELSA